MTADGNVRWTHLPSPSDRAAGFDKRGKIDRKLAATWLSEVAAAGILDLPAATVKPKEPFTTIDGLVNGKKAKLKVAGLPSSQLQSKIDQATAHTLEAKK